MSLAAVIMFALFLGACGIGVPIGFSMIASGLVYLLLVGGDLGLVAAQGVHGLFKSFILLAVPLFIFAAEVMTASNISDRLLQFVMLVVGVIAIPRFGAPGAVGRLAAAPAADRDLRGGGAGADGPGRGLRRPDAERRA